MLYPLINAKKYELVHNAPGGASALAPVLNISPGTLLNKVNTKVATHHLSLDEALALQIATANYDLLKAEALTLGFIILPLPSTTLVSDIELLNAYTKVNKEFGEAANVMHEALKDGKITKDECKNFHTEVFDVINALLALAQRFEQLGE
jgi:hypothetical protein